MNILNFFQPPATEFNIWHVLISLMSLIFQYDIENQQRYFVNETTVEVSAWSLIWSSGPSEMIGLLTAALLTLGRIRYMAIPFICNVTMLTIFRDMHSYGSAFGLGSSFKYLQHFHCFLISVAISVHIGLGYSWKVTGWLNLIAIVLAAGIPNPVSYHFPRFCSPEEKVIQLCLCQAILYFGAWKFPTFFEDCFSSMVSRRTLNDVVPRFIESHPLLRTSEVVNYKILEETTLNEDGYDNIVRRFWKLLYPSDENFTFWLLLVGFFSLLLHHDVENCQRMEIHKAEESNSTWVALYSAATCFYQTNSTEQMEYIRVLIESSPSAFTSFVSGVILAIPKIYLIATNPIISNLSVF
ncbi:hypothetical protein CRE_02987 [Caenorhabditis remanei]|uniref:Uncharacterized protein n=1 Tax=Caenorhabditis remanei TaxID=31234 RepID=E3LX24_CAERE|nr:hypothetical protein CRE_02987 [Caenorhabditis remanei]